MTLLTAIEPTERHVLRDAARAIAWSHEGRAIALGADGRALLCGDGRLTAPIGPDPIGCAWLDSDRVAVVDGALGVIVAGGGSVDVAPITGALDIVAPSPGDEDAPAEPRYVVIAGHQGVSVVPADPGGAQRSMAIDTGPVRTAVHLGGAIWIAGGADSLAVVDVALGCVDERIELSGTVALAAARSAERVAAADATGAIHVFDLADMAGGAEVTGYPDAVRHLGIDPTGDVVVAAADDELTWWGIDAVGRIADQPDASVAHSAPITACAVGATGFVATGDHDGLVRLWSPLLRDLPVASVHLEGEITVLAWSHCGERLAAGSARGHVLVADVSAGDLL